MFFAADSGPLKIGSSKGGLGNRGDDLKALDLGLGLNVGYLLAKGFYARAHYQMGLSNLDPFADAHDAYKTSAYGITVGYYFNQHKSNAPKPKGGKK